MLLSVMRKFFLRETLSSHSNFKLLSERPRWTKRLASYLSDLDVPLDEHPGIIKDIFTMAEGENVVPGGVTSIYAVIADTCVHVIQDVSSVESSTAHMYQNMLMTPAAKSCLEGLEKVRVDDDVIRETPSCVICHDNIDHLDNNAAKEEEERVLDLDHHQPLTITRLPCSHQFHGYCIVQWLKIQHLCPVCRYAMPTEEETDETESKRRRVM